MTPRIAKAGTSFKGAALYYLHDKDAQTSERVAFTHTLNLPTNDPRLAVRHMIDTAVNADTLKKLAGEKTTGRKTKTTVFHISLAWHPEQNPPMAEQDEAAHSALAHPGIEKHQACLLYTSPSPRD